MSNVYSLLLNFEGWKISTSYNPSPAIFLFILFLMPYATIIGSVLSNTADPYLETEPRNIKLFLKDVIHHDRNIDGCVMLNDKFVTDISWYCKAIELENIPVKLTKFENLDPCWKLIVCLPNEQKIIENKYNTQKLDSFKTVITYQLGGLKEK